MDTDLDAARQWIEARYPLNDAQRIVSESNNPVFVFVRTRLGCIWRFRADLPSQLVGELAKLAGREPAISLPISASTPPERLMPLTRILDQAGFSTAPAHELVAFDTDLPTADAYVFTQRDQASEGSGSP